MIYNYKGSLNVNLLIMRVIKRNEKRKERKNEVN